MEEITDVLYAYREEAYAQFQANLIPTVAAETILGVRTPKLKELAKKWKAEEAIQDFYKELPHTYFEENQLHGFLISEIKDFDECIEKLEKFLPYIDNWATCDQLSPKIFQKKKEALLEYIKKWLQAEDIYTVRFAIGMLMKHYLDEDFEPEYLKWVSRIESEEYYIRMEIAWYMATALAKQWESAVYIVEENVLETWVHNKTIQKARESRRITEEKKEYLKTLKR